MTTNGIRTTTQHPPQEASAVDKCEEELTRGLSFPRQGM
ncbi:hypothetical protein CEXT_309061, partial [Caerostris extrusa]